MTFHEARRSLATRQHDGLTPSERMRIVARGTKIAEELVDAGFNGVLVVEP
jgi:predicted aspartyl protease